jgi:CBS domain-containing protein
MICPACGYENLPGSALCDNCNIDLTRFEEQKPVTKSKIERAILQDKLAKVGKEKSIALIVSPQKAIKEVIELMLKAHKFSAVIMDGESIEGIFTERSLLKRVCNESPINIDKPISEAMLKKPKVLKPENSVVDALHMMEVGGYTYAIIEDDPLRVINIRDILEYIIELEQPH